MQDIYTLSLSDTAPSSITQDPHVKSIIKALDPELQAVSQSSLEPLIFARIDELPETVLDLLAWQLHADFYDLASDIARKRSVIKTSLHWHMHKGTQWAILEALKQIDIKADFVHWHDDSSQPYTFKLKAIVAGDFYKTKGKDKLMSSIRRAVEESKSARSWMAEIDTRIEDEDSPELYTAHLSTANIDINLGVNLDDMQELLLRFEQRIMNRINDYEQKVMLALNTHQAQTNQKLDEILEMLRWKGADETI